MFAGVAFALAAGMMWGLVFVGPLLLPEYPASLQSCGRYLAFGLISLPLGWLDRSKLARLTYSDWLEALKLAGIGNLLYYLFLAGAIQRAGGPLPTMIIGMLPVVISISTNLMNDSQDGYLPWAKLLPFLSIILAGVACVNQTELAALSNHKNADLTRYAFGALLSVGALICWTWYPIRNAKWLREHPEHNPRAWATAQGLATLPLALMGYALFLGFSAATSNPFPMPFGTQPLVFISLMATIGLFSSWLGTLFWNEASQRLPTAMIGQLIVFETLAALLYAYLLRWQWPEPLTILGVILMLAGVLGAAKIKPKHKEIVA